LPYAPEPQRFEIGRIYKAVKDELNSTNEKVYIIWNSDTSKGFNHLVLKYFLTPFPSNNFGWDLGETALEYNLYKVNFSSESWMKLLIDQKYTHVVIAAADEGFWDKYGLLFDTFSRNKYPQLFLVTGEKLLNIELPSSTD